MEQKLSVPAQCPGHGSGLKPLIAAGPRVRAGYTRVSRQPKLTQRRDQVIDNNAFAARRPADRRNCPRPHWADSPSKTS